MSDLKRQDFGFLSHLRTHLTVCFFPFYTFSLALSASSLSADIRGNQTMYRRPSCAHQRRAEVPVWAQRLIRQVLRMQEGIRLGVWHDGATDAVPDGEVDAYL